ncbi:Chemotaxis phosphatase CheX-like domain-containing protein [Desulfonema limicola]|uniref:Chemotaxis phosphatase CheX-like domain-containing protein n=1 Tax=Desulfonema limicola TaxID=45656 RepID=A0A975B9X5_9BACT|nr:chemotaxis protein CheX [Desulfonema limicola]QTA81694.1 Chemotaxis phosphatase CheX-like domain-containing protein [Desulfonema limicola]
MDVNDKIDVKLIDPFINATLNVLKTMAFTKAHTDGPYMKNEKRAKGDVSGVIGITGDYNGSLSVSFPEKSILTIVSNMFGEEMTEVDDEIRDAVGEITNMVSGQARQELDVIGISLESAIPTVISGKDHTIKHITSYPVVALTFALDEGEFLKGPDEDFTIEICLEDG